jgi:hypothetical protein
MSCPYLKEVVMLYCSGFPVRKMVSLDRIVSASPCLTQDFNGCPLYHEILTAARLPRPSVVLRAPPHEGGPAMIRHLACRLSDCCLRDSGAGAPHS